MWALVESNNVTQVYTRPKGITIGDVNYPSNIFTRWTSSELEALGIYTVVIDNSNYKDPIYYDNTNMSYAFSSGTVTASYGTATAKPIADEDILTPTNPCTRENLPNTHKHSEIPARTSPQTAPKATMRPNKSNLKINMIYVLFLTEKQKRIKASSRLG